MRILPEVKTILLSGGIGSGKSTAAAVFLSLGIPVYDADSRTKELYSTCPGLVSALEDRLGIQLRNECGDFEKARLAAFLFCTGGDEHIRMLEEILFPYLEEDFWKFAGKVAAEKNASAETPVYVAMESATAMEKAWFRDFGDFRLVVDAPYELRLARACRRDGVSRETVLARMDRQPLMNRISAGEEVSGIDAVIMNDSTEKVLAARVRETLEKLGIID